MNRRRLAAAVVISAVALAVPFVFGAAGSRTGTVRRATVNAIRTSSADRPPTMAIQRPGVADRQSVTVPLAEPVPWTLPFEGTPPGWNVKEFTGRADVELVRVDGQLAMRLRSERSSFAVYHDVALRLEDFPILTWSWKVMRLPRAADVRLRGRDDQAAQIYVIFPRWPSPITRSDVIGYVWDTSAPLDTRRQSARAENVRVIVVDTGSSRVGVWQRRQRDVAADYVALFGRTPPPVGKIAVMIDSNDTRSDAEAYVGAIAFRRGS